MLSACFCTSVTGGGGGTNARPWRERASARQMPEPCRIGPREKQSVNLQSSAQCENEKESSALSPHVRCPCRLERLKSVSLNCLPIAVDYLKGCCSLSRAERKDMAVRQIQLTERLRPQSHPRTRTATRNASSLPGRSGRARNAAQLRTVQVSQAAQGRRRNAICEASAKGWVPPPPGEWVGVSLAPVRARESTERPQTSSRLLILASVSCERPQGSVACGQRRAARLATCSGEEDAFPAVRRRGCTGLAAG